MRSAFFGLHVTTSGMNAARANLNTIAHNIANTETPGFSRQVANQQATMPLRGSPGRGMVGTGSQITSIHRVRNQFLDTKFWAQNSVLGQFNTKHDVMSLVRGILMEGEAAGITRDINNVFSRQSDLHTNAHDLTYRRNFLSSLDTFAVSLNSQYQQLRQQQVDLNQEIAIVIGQVNSKGQQINALNRSIFIMELDGSNANDLRDQRDLLIDQLSRLVNVEVRETETNADFAAGRVTDPRESRLHLSILIDGVVFINHFDINPIEVRQRVLSDGTSIARNPEEMGVKYDIFWSSGMRFNMYSPTLSGELAGLIQLRDGNGGNFARFQTTGGLPATHSVGTLAFPLPIGTTAITGISTDPIVIYGARNALEIVEMINAAAGVTVTASLGGGGIRLTANTSGAVTITTAPPLINHITGHAGVDAADMPQVVPGGTAMVPPMVPPFANPEDYAVRLVFGTDSRVDMSTTGVLQVRIGNTIRNIPYTDFRLEFDHNGNPVSGVFNVRAEDMNSPGTPIDIPALFDGATEITSGRTVNYMGVPYFMARLNELARTKAAAFNEGRRLDGSDIPGVTGHIHGFDLNELSGFAGDAHLAAMVLGFANPGGPFSPWDGHGTFNYFTITAANLAVNPHLMRHPDQMRLTTNIDDLPSGHNIVYSWSTITQDRGLFREGRLGDFIAAITGDLGVVGRQAHDFTASQGELIVAIDNQRRQVSGVSLDEEVAFMIQHQMVFQASARLFSVIDGIYDVLINRMGGW